MAILEVEHIEKHFGEIKVLKTLVFPWSRARPWPLSVPPDPENNPSAMPEFFETPDRGKIIVGERPCLTRRAGAGKSGISAKNGCTSAWYFSPLIFSPVYSPAECDAGRTASGKGTSGL